MVSYHESNKHFKHLCIGFQHQPILETKNSTYSYYMAWKHGAWTRTAKQQLTHKLDQNVDLQADNILWTDKVTNEEISAESIVMAYN